MVDTPRRVTVVSPRTSAVLRQPVAAAREIDDQTGVGDAYMRSLISSQRRLAALLLTSLGGLIATLPALFTYVAWARTTEILGAPLPWVVLGALVYPVLLALGWFFVRQAERIEQDFAELVERE